MALTHRCTDNRARAARIDQTAATHSALTQTNKHATQSLHPVHGPTTGPAARGRAAGVRGAAAAAAASRGIGAFASAAAGVRCRVRARSRRSVNAVFLDLFREALLAYQLVEPNLTGATLSSNSGDTGLAMATSGNFDWTVTTTSLPDRVRAAHRTLESYPIATVGIAPAYNLPDSVGDSTLTLSTETMCRIWRGNITHWSVAVRRQRSGGRCTAGVRAISQHAAARRMCVQC